MCAVLYHRHIPMIGVMWACTIVRQADTQVGEGLGHCVYSNMNVRLRSVVCHNPDNPKTHCSSILTFDDVFVINGGCRAMGRYGRYV